MILATLFTGDYDSATDCRKRPWDRTKKPDLTATRSWHEHWHGQKSQEPAHRRRRHRNEAEVLQDLRHLPCSEELPLCRLRQLRRQVRSPLPLDRPVYRAGRRQCADILIHNGSLSFKSEFSECLNSVVLFLVQRNYRFYLLLIALALAFYTYTLAFSLRRTRAQLDAAAGAGLLGLLRSWPEMVALAAFSSMAVWLLACLLAYHVFLAAKNQVGDHTEGANWRWLDLQGS